MNDKLGWGDYEIVLRIAAAGSLTGAANEMGSSHPTLFRKINAIEEKLGVRIFDRLRTGYQLTPAGEEVAATARQIEELTNETERRVAGRDLRPSGVVRLATTDALLVGMLAPRIAGLRRIEPEIVLDVVVSNEISDLSFREADIALRPASAPDDHLFGRRLGTIKQAVYSARLSEPEDAGEPPWSAFDWIGPSNSMPYGQLHAWMRETGCDKSVVSRMDSVVGMHGAVRAGSGVAVLPCYLGDPDRDLRRIGPPISKLGVDLWLLTHPDLRHTARVRAVLDHLASLQDALV